MGYPSDLSDAEWEIIREHFPEQGKMGRPRKYTSRQILNALFYIDRTGCQWRYLPADFPPWCTVYFHFRVWRDEGRIDRVHDALRRKLRTHLGHDPEPSAASIDSQSVKTSDTVILNKGFDGHKQIKGRKRHLLVDTLGLILAVWVHSAGLVDRSVACDFVERTPAPSMRLEVVWGDMGYVNGALNQEIQEHWHARLEILKHPWQGPHHYWVPPGVRRPRPPKKPEGFVVLPKRWVVERTFAWLGHHRRHSKDYERLTLNSEAWIRLSMIRLMSLRLSLPA